MNKVLVLGAGRGQIPLMKIAKRYGYEIIAVSPKGNYPGLKIADKVLFENVKDMEKVLSYAEKEGIDAIVTDQLDAGVLTAAYVAEKLGVNGIGYDCALKFTNKYIMRKAASDAGINVPKYICISDTDEINLTSELCYPLIIKPVDSAASRGVKKVSDADEFKKYFEFTKSYSKSGRVIAEEFIEGEEFVVEAYTSNKITTNLCIGYRDYFDIPGTFIPNATVFVDSESAQSDIEKRILETNIKLVKAFGLPYGITHGEYIYDKKADKVYLVEIAARGGGVFISSDLIPASCGVDANELLFRDATGFGNNESIRLSQGSAAYFCYLTPEGTVTKLDGIYDVENIDGVLKAFFDNIEIGAETKSILDKSSRKGPILVEGNNEADCLAVIEKVKKTVDIKVLSDGILKNVIWN